MSTHAQIFRAGAQVALGLTVAALSLALGAGPAVAVPGTPPGGGTPTDTASAPTDGDQKLATLTGKVWEDVNHDGIQAHPDAAQNEDPIRRALVVVSLQGADAEEVPEIIEKVEKAPEAKREAMLLTLGRNKIRRTYTNSSGVYTFSGLPAGEVRVSVFPNRSRKKLADQYYFTKVNVGKDDAVDSDFTQVLDNVTERFYFGVVKGVTLKVGETTDLDAGVIDPKTPADNGVACVQAWNDRNRNGLREKAEVGIANLTVAVSEAPSQDPAPAPSALRKLVTAKPTTSRREDHIGETDTTGKACFDRLTAGKYRAMIALGPVKKDRTGAVIGFTKEWTLTKQNVGSNDAVDSDFALIVKDVPAEFKDTLALSDSFVVKDDETTTVDAGGFKDEPTPTPSQSDEPTLPTTGAAAGGILGAGALLLGGGVALTIAARRRRRTAA